nr:hypothetical protein [Methylocystis hirsuta]
MMEFLDWLRDHNEGLPAERRVSFHGLVFIASALDRSGSRLS